jgi:hypothetical protein
MCASTSCLSLHEESSFKCHLWVCELEVQDNVYFGTGNNLQRIEEIAIFEDSENSQVLRMKKQKMLQEIRDFI